MAGGAPGEERTGHSRRRGWKERKGPRAHFRACWGGARAPEGPESLCVFTYPGYCGGQSVGGQQWKHDLGWVTDDSDLMGAGGQQTWEKRLYSRVYFERVVKSVTRERLRMTPRVLTEHLSAGGVIY